MWTVIKAQFRLLYKYYLLLIPLMIYLSVEARYEPSRMLGMLAFYIGFLSGNGQSGYYDIFILNNLPVKRRSILIGKYVFSMGTSIIIFTIVSLVMNYLSNNTLFADISLNQIIFYILALMFMSSFPIPFVVRYSRRKAMLLSMLISVSIMITSLVVMIAVLPDNLAWNEYYMIINKILALFLFVSLVIGSYWAKCSLKKGVTEI